MEFEQLRNDMVMAMKAKDKPRKEAISSLMGAIKKVAIDEGCRENISTELIGRVILKELKTVKEQIDTCPTDRTDLLEGYQLTYDVMQEYAPSLMTMEEVKSYIEIHFPDILATKNKGQIMKAVVADLKGKADGKVMNQVVADLCQ